MTGSAEDEAPAVIVVAYNCSELLADNLSRCDRGPGAQIIVVDNSDDVVERMQTSAVCARHGWEYLPQPTNGGFGAGANAGAEHALAGGASVLLFVNPDAWLENDALSQLSAACTEQPHTAFSPVIRKPDGGLWFTGGALDLRSGRTSGRADRVGGPVRWLTGAALALSSDLWTSVGGFDPGYFLYWEDVDLGWRVGLAGGELAVLPGARAVHSVGGTQGSGPKTATYVYFNSRNRLAFAGHYLGARLRWRWLLSTPRISWELIGMADRTPAAFWAALRGVMTGLATWVRAAPRARPASAAPLTLDPAGRGS